MAVYTEVSDEDLARFISRYDAGDLLSYKGIAEGVENTNYIVHTTRAQYILTLYEKRVATSDLPFFLGLMEHLAKRGVTCPQPVRDRKGANVSELAGRPAALVTFLDGFWLRRPKAEHCAALGRELARLHLAGKDFPMVRPNALGLAGWRPLFQRFANEADRIAPHAGRLIAGELDHLEAAWPKSLASGVIHADLFPDNVFFLNDKLSGLIDFYFACTDMMAYDIAVTHAAWCFDASGETIDAALSAALLAGYRSVRALSRAELAALPLLAQGAALRFTLSRAYDWLNTPADALVTRKDPMPMLRRLQFYADPANVGLFA